MSIFVYGLFLFTASLLDCNAFKAKSSFERSISLTAINNDMNFNEEITKLRKPIVSCLVAVSLCLPQLASVHDAKAVGGNLELGMTLFRRGDVKGSINEFDKATMENPSLSNFDWQRGLSLYYVEQYVEGGKQFRNDIAANPQDVEEIIWTVMCDSKLLGYDKALEIMPKLRRAEKRPVMRTVYDLFTGKIPEKNLLELGDLVGSNDKSGDYFYSRLYLSLYRLFVCDKDVKT
jgi:lipoprotein NlpI